VNNRGFVRDDATIAMRVEALGDDRYRVHVGEHALEATALALPDGGIWLQFAGGAARVAYGAPTENGYHVRLAGRTWTLRSPDAQRRGKAAGADGHVRAPMTGTVLEVGCQPGDKVAADQTLVVLSAMKMEHKLKAGIAGTVASVAAAAGATVDQGAVLVVVEPE
jgi:biotin carboxyl carrier protein